MIADIVEQRRFVVEELEHDTVRVGDGKGPQSPEFPGQFVRPECGGKWTVPKDCFPLNRRLLHRQRESGEGTLKA